MLSLLHNQTNTRLFLLLLGSLSTILILASLISQQRKVPAPMKSVTSVFRLPYLSLTTLIPLLIFTRGTLTNSPWVEKLTLSLSLILFLLWIFSRDNLLNKIGVPDTAIQLGFIRFVVCSSLLILVFRNDLSSSKILPSDLANHLLLPKLIFIDIPLLDLRDTVFLVAVRWVSCFSLALAALGVGGRWTLILATISYTLFYYVQVTYTHFYHSGLIPLQILVVLCLFPSHRRFKLIGLFQCSQKISEEDSSAIFQYGIFCCWLVYALDYFMTGLSKWYDPLFWGKASTIQGYAATDSLTLIQHDFNLGPWLIQAGIPNFIWTVVAVFAMTLELAAVLILFNRRFHIFIIPGIVLLHIGIFIFHEFLFIDLIILPLIFLGIKNKNRNDSEPAVRPAESMRLHFCRNMCSPALVCSVVAVVLLSGWMYQIVLFPIMDTWPMYAGAKRNSVVEYPVLKYRTVSNKTLNRTDLSEWVSILNHGRWIDVIPFPEGPNDVRWQKAVSAVARHNNDIVDSKEDHITFFELEKWRWDIDADKHSLTFGKPIQTWKLAIE